VNQIEPSGISMLAFIATWTAETVQVEYYFTSPVMRAYQDLAAKWTKADSRFFLRLEKESGPCEPPSDSRSERVWSTPLPQRKPGVAQSN
jgi:hypothetical protein